MSNYKNLGGNSGVVSYQAGSDRIIVTFNTNVSYEYTYVSSGTQHIENMKSLAKKGKGLNSYINKYVKTKFSRKL